MSRTSQGIGKRLVEAVWKDGCWKLTVDGRDCKMCDLGGAPLTPEELCAAYKMIGDGTFDPTDEFVVCKQDGTCEKITLPSICEMMAGVPEGTTAAINGDKVLVIDANGGCSVKELDYTVDVEVTNFDFDPDTLILTITDSNGTTHPVDLTDLLCCRTVSGSTVEENCPDPVPATPVDPPANVAAAGSTHDQIYRDCIVFYEWDGTSWSLTTVKKDCCVEVAPVTDADLTTAGDPDSGVATYVANNSVTNTYLYYIGDGTAEDPDYTWYVDHNGVIINTESPDKCCPITTEIPASAFADPENPTEAEVSTYITTNNIVDPGILILVGDGTTGNPDYVWNQDSNGVVTNTESPACPDHAIHGEFCYVGEEEICDCTNEVTLFREDFETPSDQTAGTLAPDGLGSWNTDFTLATSGAPYFAQLYAEGIYMVMPAGFVPVSNGGAQPDIHGNWIEYAPFASGYAAFNLQPSTGASGQRMLYRDIDVEEGKCYSLKLKIKDTHTPDYNDANNVSLADIGMVVNGVIVDNTGPIGAGLNTDDGNVYTVSWIADTTGTVEIAFISNNAETNGNDVFINWTEVVCSGTKPQTLKGAYRYVLDCDGNVDSSVPPVPVDSEGVELVDPEIVDCPRVVEKTEFNTIIADIQGDIQGGVGSTSSITVSTGVDGERTITHDDGNGNLEPWCEGTIIKDEDGRTALFGCTPQILHRTLHVNNLHGGSVGPTVIGVSHADSDETAVNGITTRHSRVAISTFNGTATGNQSLVHGLGGLASGARSASFNGANVASGTYSFSTGNGNTASGFISSNLGSGGNATAFASATQGANNLASNSQAFATGSNTIASGFSSLSANVTTQATGSAASSFGSFTIASGQSSFTSGQRSEATAQSAFATGGDTRANNVNSTAIGQESVADADISFAQGFRTLTEGITSVAMGHGTITGCRAQTAIGLHNIQQGAVLTAAANDDYAFIIGNGLTGPAARSNAYAVTYNGVHSFHAGLLNLTANPTVAANGTPLVGGEQYYNSATGRMTYYDAVAAIWRQM